VSLAVVKVGGSFCRYKRLRELAASLAQAGGSAVIVPGGGPFADCVRREQVRLGCGDAAAHRMALLAMAQFGTALADLSDGLAAAASLPALRAAVGSRRAPVWLPLHLLDGDPTIAETWEMTSDSLAAWLAVQLGADRLFFLKRGSQRHTARLADLVGEGVLDPLVPNYLAGSGVAAYLCGQGDFPALGDALAAGRAIGRPIALA
jgi:5-(aminomethyl)-3-furanmethanol phosphate kinase